jgi:hypothetical protein
MSKRIGLAERLETRHGFSPARTRHACSESGRVWAEGMARRARPDTARFYFFFLFFHINTYIIFEYRV